MAIVKFSKIALMTKISLFYVLRGLIYFFCMFWIGRMFDDRRNVLVRYESLYLTLIEQQILFHEPLGPIDRLLTFPRRGLKLGFTNFNP